MSSKVMLIVWMPAEDPSPLASWAHLVAMRRFLQGRGIRVSRCICNLRPPDSPRPNLLRVFARRDGVPVERYGPLRGFRGLGILPVGSDDERSLLCSEVSAVLQDFGFLGVLATIRQ